MVSHNFNSSTWEVEIDLGVRGQPHLQSGFWDSQVYTEKLRLKKKKKNPRENESIKLLVDKSVVHFLD